MDFPLPPVGEGLIEVELTQWFIEPGATVRRGQPLMEVMSDKATMEIPAPFSGTVVEVVGEAGKKIKVGDVVLRYQLSGATETAPAEVSEAMVNAASVSTASPNTAKSVDATNMREAAPQQATRVAAAPSVRLLARKLGIDLTTVPGSGPAGRILVDDVSSAWEANIAKNAASADQTRTRPAKPNTPPLDFGKPGTTVPLVGVRRKIAEQMLASVSHIPHYSLVEECDFTEVVRLRQQLKDDYAARGFKLTYLPFIVKAVVQALKAIPIVNATHDDATNQTTLHAAYHVGIAVAGPQGLLVPVIRNADQLTLAQVAKEIDRLSADVRQGKVKPADLGGGTFTITSIGNIGGLIATPIINRPEVGIVAVGKIVRQPRYNEKGEVMPADIGYLSFSFDHRIIDGAIAAHFSNAVLSNLHKPIALVDALLCT